MRIKPAIAMTVVVLTATACTPKDGKRAGFLKEKICKQNKDGCVQRAKKILKSKNLTIFEEFDHAKNAKEAAMDLKPNVTLSFGDPKVGTKLMQCNPSMGLDLPLRINFNTDYEGITHIIYTNPTYWTLKHNIKDKKCLEIVRKLSIGLDMLTDKIAK